MPRDTNQTYSLPEAPFVAGTVASPTAVNANFSDIALALTASLTRGETTSWSRGLLDDIDASAGRATLDAGATGDALFLAATAAAARATIDTLSRGEALRYRNRVINPAMQISQERGTALVDCTTGGPYAIDQWIAALSTTPGGTLRMQQIASATPGGSPFRLRATAQVADASIAAGDRYAIEQPIEGQMIADARFGSASARQLLVRFGVRSSVAGTFGVSIRNGAANRAWVGTITIGAGEVNTDLVRTLVIPGDTTGTWPTDSNMGMVLDVTLAAGTTFHGTAGWQSANVLTTAAQTNFMATGGATFELFDVGLYVDTLGLGVFPPFEVPALDDELRRCRRYWRTLGRQVWGWANAAGQGSFNYSLDVPMRATPNVAFLVSNWSTYRNSGNSNFPSPLAIIDAAADTQGGRVTFSHGGALTVDELWGSLQSDVLALSARL